MNERILIIDDETNIRAMMRLALAHSGYTVTVASDGREGVATYGDGSGFDLVLLDQRMPGMPGIEVQREILRIRPDARIIIITAFGTIDLAVEAIRAGASDFLRKPFTADTLRAAVTSALARRECRERGGAVKGICREFTRATINGFSFTLESESYDSLLGDVTCVFAVHRGNEGLGTVRVELPAFVQELVLASADCECVPGGMRFWQAMCEEVLANHLWHNAALPENDEIRIEDLTSSMQKWLDSMLTVREPEPLHA